MDYTVNEEKATEFTQQVWIKLILEPSEERFTVTVCALFSLFPPYSD